MQKKRVLIVGAGVSGLSAAWHLAKKSDQYECVLIEKESAAGGWMSSEKVDGFLLEKGPRVFKTSRNLDLLHIVEDLGLTSSLLPSSKDAKARYLWTEGRFCKIPKDIFSLLSACLRESFQPPFPSDETIWDFACRRFGLKVAESIFDPMVLGIYGGDCKKLSTASCFPQLKRWEQEKGSVVKGAFSSFLKKKKKARSVPLKSPLFSFQEGSGFFIDRWVSALPCPVHFNEEALALEKIDRGWRVSSSSKTWEAEEVILAVPASAAAKLLASEAPSAAELLTAIPYQEITTIRVGWKDQVLPFKAFGYLVPSKERLPLLGVLFDSAMFSRKETLITLMVRGASHTQEAIENFVRIVASEHLQIAQSPSLVSVQSIPQAIPQYLMGHLEKKEKIFGWMKEKVSNLHLIGNYLEGVSVNDSIRQGKLLIESFF